MLAIRQKRINKTSLPNQTLPGKTFQESQLSYFYKIKTNDVFNAQKQHSQHIRRQTSLIPRAYSFKKNKQISNNSDLIEQVNKNAAGNAKVKKAKKANLSLAKYLQLNEDDFELSNIKKVINGTNLGALSERSILQKMESQHEQQQKQQSFIFRSNAIKRMDSQQDLGASLVAENLLTLTTNNNNRRERTRKSSQISNNIAHNLWNNSKTLNFIFGGEKDFLNTYKQHQMSLMQKVNFYKQRKTTIDFKSQWKV